MAENEDLIWKSYMYSLKQGTLKFLLNASIDKNKPKGKRDNWKIQVNLANKANWPQKANMP